MPLYNEQLSQYVVDNFVPSDGFLSQVPSLSAAQGLPEIHITPEEGRFLQVLVSACQARRALEIGTLGGYSGIWIARSLAPGGKLITIEQNPHHAQVAQEHFARAGVLDKVEIRQGNALQILPTLVSENPFDFVFIDADKSGYRQYLDWAIEHTRLGGVIAAHNAFWYGKVIQGDIQDKDTVAVRQVTRYAATNPRLCSTIYPAGDGTLVCVKIS